MTVPVSSPLENSGSLTGHILAQGWADTPGENGSTTRAMLVLLVGLGVLVAVGILLAFVVGDAFSTLFGGLAGG